MGLHKGQTNGGSFKKGVKQTPEFVARRMKKLLTMPRTKEWCERISQSHKGEKNPSFGMRGERSFRYIKDRALLKKTDHRANSANWDWKKQCRKRDGYKCRIADIHCNGQLEVHHILSYKEFPELRYEVNNGITLCHYHHPRKKIEEVRMSPYFQELVKTV